MEKELNVAIFASKIFATDTSMVLNKTMGQNNLLVLCDIISHF